MESLAAVVAFLFLTALLSGPIALGLTFLKARSRTSRLVRRSFVTMFALWGSLNGLQFILANIPFFARLIGVMSVTTSAFAFKREFGAKKTVEDDEIEPDEGEEEN